MGLINGYLILQNERLYSGADDALLILFAGLAQKFNNINIIFDFLSSLRKK